LITLLAYPGSSIDRLRRALGLTHSGGVRLVDRLEADGLVRRSTAADGRAVALELTSVGRRRAKRTLDRREAALSTLLSPLSETERATLTGLLERVLEPLPRDGDDLERICRLCDYWTCDGTTLACPVGRGARARRDEAGR
jgi:DNA-binding MarR family transcriptional regulator